MNTDLKHAATAISPRDDSTWLASARNRTEVNITQPIPGRTRADTEQRNVQVTPIEPETAELNLMALPQNSSTTRRIDMLRGESQRHI